ncbi:MAG: hypothetical protein ACM3ZQ_07545, partial [Bacillota bacterium]
KCAPSTAATDTAIVGSSRCGQRQRCLEDQPETIRHQPSVGASIRAHRRMLQNSDVTPSNGIVRWMAFCIGIRLSAVNCSRAAMLRRRPLSPNLTIAGY